MTRRPAVPTHADEPGFRYSAGEFEQLSTRRSLGAGIGHAVGYQPAKYDDNQQHDRRERDAVPSPRRNAQAHVPGAIRRVPAVRTLDRVALTVMAKAMTTPLIAIREAVGTGSAAPEPSRM